MGLPYAPSAPCPGGEAHETSCCLGLQGAHNLFTRMAELASTTECEEQQETSTCSAGWSWGQAPEEELCLQPPAGSAESKGRRAGR